MFIGHLEFLFCNLSVQVFLSIFLVGFLSFDLKPKFVNILRAHVGGWFFWDFSLSPYHFVSSLVFLGRFFKNIFLCNTLFFTGKLAPITWPATSVKEKRVNFVKQTLNWFWPLPLSPVSEPFGSSIIFCRLLLSFPRWGLNRCQNAQLVQSDAGFISFLPPPLQRHCAIIDKISLILPLLFYVFQNKCHYSHFTGFQRELK